MNPVLLWSMAGAAILILSVLAILVLSGGKAARQEPQRPADVSIAASPGSIVTVRKVGTTTRVDIRPDVHDHWEGDRDIDVAPTPIEATRREEPALYAEYMSPSTSATRKYEIAEYLYGIGLTLPFIPGLYEKMQSEKRPAQKDVQRERAPRDLSSQPAGQETVRADAGTSGDGPSYRRLDVDEQLRHQPLPELGPEPDESQKTPPEPTDNNNPEQS